MFTHLHVHTLYSLLDANIKLDELFQRVKELGQNSIAITDHGNMYGAVEFYKTAKKYGIKPIIGCECYICSDVTIKSRENTMYHLILLAKNEQGRQNLQHLVKESTLYKFNKRHRIDFNMLEKYHEGLICLSACMAGEVSKALSGGSLDKAVEIATKYKNLFGEDYYIEYQAHTEAEQQKLNEQLVRLATMLDIKYVVTCDAHYLTQDEQKYHSIFVKIGQTREVGEIYNDCYIQSEEEVIGKCQSTIPYNIKAIQTTQEIADKCNVDYPLSAPIIPHTTIPQQFKSEQAYLQYLCNKGFKDKGFADWNLSQWKQYFTQTIYDEDGIAEKKEIMQFDSVREIVKIYKERAKYEIDAVVKMGFEGYYLLVHSYISSAKRRGIARGSAGGSLLAYLSGIVDIDPVKYGLYFERFIDVGALELLKNNQITKKELKIPDVDADFSPTDRDKVMRFIVDTYNEKNVVSLGVFQYIWAKGAIKDIGRVLEIPFEVTNEMTKLLGDETIDEALENGVLDRYKDDYPELFDYASHLAGLPKSYGVHPCGKVICMQNADYYNALEYVEDKNTWALQGDMHTADDLGLVKIDLLGLRTLDVIYDVLDMIGEDYDFIAPHKLNLCDEKVWHEFAQGNSLLIFQFESQGMRQMLSEMKCNSIENLSAANALYRPGSKAYIPSYIARKKGTEEIVYLHEDLKPILDNTYGIIVYQEQLIEIGRLAGLRNPDELRKATAKKKPELMAKIEPELKDGLKKRDWTQQQVDELWQDILVFARYSFNKCVSGSTTFIKSGQKKSVRNPTVKEMFMIKNDLQFAKENNYIPLRSKYLRQGYGNALAMYPDGKIRKNRIVDITESGVRSVYRLTTKTGRYIDATLNHKIPTPKGVKLLEELTVGDSVYILGEYKAHQKCYNFTDGSYERNYPHKGEQGFQHIADGASVKFDNFRKESIAQSRPCEMCGKQYGEDRFEVHHKDGNRHNNDISNFMWCCVSCHKKLEYQLGRTKVYEKGIDTNIDEIVSIEYLCDEMTYDVEMAAPAHTFVANNGIVVSNSHSSAYALTAYITMFLKVYYPVEFITAYINSYDGDTKKIAEVLQEAKRLGVIYKFDQWANIQGRTTNRNGIVYLGINTIKGFGENVALALNEVGTMGCVNFVELIKALMENSNIDKSQIETMIRLNFFSTYGKRARLLKIYKLFNEVYTAKIFNKTKLPDIQEDIIRKYARETAKQYRDIDNDGLFNELCSVVEDKDISLKQQIKDKFEYQGIIDYINPNLLNYAYVLKTNTKYSPKIKLYYFNNGEVEVCKVSKKVYVNNPINEGDIVYLADIKKKFKYEKVGDEWVQNTNAYDTWIEKYIIK